MLTSNQLLVKGRFNILRRDKTPVLFDKKVRKKKPQVEGKCLKVFTKTPRKPNSAIRKVTTADFKPTNSRNITVYIPGIGHTLKPHSKILIRGGRVPDLPGVKYKCIRNARKCDLKDMTDRKNGRSKYGRKHERNLR